MRGIRMKIVTIMLPTFDPSAFIVGNTYDVYFMNYECYIVSGYMLLYSFEPHLLTFLNAGKDYIQIHIDDYMEEPLNGE